MEEWKFLETKYTQEVSKPAESGDTHLLLDAMCPNPPHWVQPGDQPGLTLATNRGEKSGLKTVNPSLFWSASRGHFGVSLCHLFERRSFAQPWSPSSSCLVCQRCHGDDKFMTSERASLGALVTDEALQVPCKQQENSAEGNSDEIYAAFPGTDITPGLGPPQPTGFTLPVPWALLPGDQAEINPAKTSTGAAVGQSWRQRSVRSGSAPGEVQCMRSSTRWSIFHLLLGEKCGERSQLHPWRTQS